LACQDEFFVYNFNDIKGNNEHALDLISILQLEDSCFLCVITVNPADGLAGEKTWRTPQTTMRRYKYAV
jgi:hypothetical protein